MKRAFLLFSILFTPLTFLLFNVANAQDQVVHRDSLYSQILKEKRPLNIVFPKNYNPESPEQYEIIYCLDDISDFLKIEWEMLQWEGFIPKNMIMVGITNTEQNGVNMRERDFTPTKTSDVSGGAEQFLSFFKNELIPYIKNKYKAKTSGHTLYGGSLGGLFVMYAFLNDSNLFTSYIAIDPSLWWNSFYLNGVASNKFDSLKSLNNTLFIIGREGDFYKLMGIAGIDSILHAKAPVGLDWKCMKYSNETHYSTNFKGFWDGLKFSYGGFYASPGGYYPTSRKIAIKPKRGIVLKDKPFKLICYNLMADTYVHYTTDGTEPTKSSPTLAGDETPLILKNNSKIILKSIGKREEYNRIDSCYFEIGSVFSAILRPKEIKPGGLHYAYYEGEWDTLPNLRKIKPATSGLAGKNFNVNKSSGKKNFACLMDGYIEIDQPGYYIFEMGSGNDYSKVYLGNQLILGNHFVHSDGEAYMMPLEKGFYPFRIEYFHKKGDNDLQPIYLKPENTDDFPIPSEMLYSRY